MMKGNALAGITRVEVLGQRTVADSAGLSTNEPSEDPIHLLHLGSEGTLALARSGHSYRRLHEYSIPDPQPDLKQLIFFSNIGIF